MQRVIYADVLVIINFYVTYFLLCATALLSKSEINRVRFMISSFLGGAYSLSILLPEVSVALSCALKLGALIVPVIIGFKIRSTVSLLKLCLCFVLCNFVFAGLMMALWYFVHPSGMYFNTTVLYLDIDILSLVIFTVVCYGFVRVFEFFFRTRAPINTIFYCEVMLDGKSYMLKAFLDTGNNLADPFSSKPVIIADKSIFNEKIQGEDFSEGRLRYVLCTTVSGKSLLPSFVPDAVHIKGADSEFTTDEVMIALTEEKLLSGEYDAILPMGLFNNKHYRKDERESEENYSAFKKSEVENKKELFTLGGVLCQRFGESAGTADKREGE